VTTLLALSETTEQSLTEGWTLALTPPDAFTLPSELPPDIDVITAPVPGTVAEALEAVGRFDRFQPTPLNGSDAWYRLTLISEGAGRATLRFEGLATIAEIYLNGLLVSASQNMFVAHEIPVTLTGADELAICFRALARRLDKTGPRARWRSQMMSSQGLRLIRTTALGYMPGWCPEIHAAGPWRPIKLIKERVLSISDLSLRSELTQDGTGVLSASFRVNGNAASVQIGCSGEWVELQHSDQGLFHGELRIADIEPWWPHTHGTPKLHEVSILVDGKPIAIGNTGFRRIAIDRGTDGNGFGLTINGEAVFSRGAVWTSADIVRLPGNRKDYEPWLRLASEAGMNMIRIGGTMAYETPDFYALCDELGLMVWQDLMLANFDYPTKDEGFLEQLGKEVSQLLHANALSPSLTIVCGGSEMYQQGAMLGLPEHIWKGPLTEEILPQQISAIRPDVAYVPNSPCGGALPFFPNAGVGHYYGVGAYCRPLSDARQANVRFAAECLAFANIPQQRTLDKHLPARPFHDPLWKARVPRDRGASWDFEDIRDHYLNALYDVDPSRQRRENVEHYLDLSRAVTAEVMEATFAEWRRNGSSCQGAIVWTLQDLVPGAGWGIVDSTGEPKPVWYALKRAFRPVQITLLDEGSNGLDIHLNNETARSIDATVEITCLRDGAQPVVGSKRDVAITARQKQTISATDLFGAFFDTTYAYRFGPAAHDGTVAKLRDKATGTVLSEAFHFPLGRTPALNPAAIRAETNQSNGRWFLKLETDRLAQSVHIDAEGFRPADDWFHLAPGEPKTVELFPLHGKSEVPTGEIRSISNKRPIRF
jgi:beta-mannosidase